MNPQRLEALVLARLSVTTKSPPSRSDVARGLFPFVSHRLTEGEWRRELESLVARLRASGDLDPKRLVLTERGRARLAEILDVSPLPAMRGWREFKTKYLPRLLDGTGSSELEDGNPALGIVARELGVSPESARSEAALGDAWLKKALGLRGKKVTLDAVRAVLLARELGLPERQRTKEVVHLCAVKLTGAKSAKREDVLQARARSWLEADGNGAKTGARERPAARGNGAARAPTGTPDPRRAVEKILAAARAPGTTRFGSGKAFIGAVWQRLSTDPELGGLGEAGFKRLLVEAHQRGELTLSRADLVSAMDPKELEASETRHLNATYHFIQINGDGS